MLNPNKKHLSRTTKPNYPHGNACCPPYLQIQPVPQTIGPVGSVDSRPRHRTQTGPVLRTAESTKFQRLPTPDSDSDSDWSGQRTERHQDDSAPSSRQEPGIAGKVEGILSSLCSMQLHGAVATAPSAPPPVPCSQRQDCGDWLQQESVCPPPRVDTGSPHRKRPTGCSIRDDFSCMPTDFLCVKMWFEWLLKDQSSTMIHAIRTTYIIKHHRHCDAALPNVNRHEGFLKKI